MPVLEDLAVQGRDRKELNMADESDTPSLRWILVMVLVVAAVSFIIVDLQLPPNEVVKNPLDPNTPLVRLSFPISQFNQVLSLIQSGGAALYFYPASPNDSFIAIKKTHVGYTVS